ncbi:hypothetical protein [Flavobacterium okayamense]|uniref:Tetratricopeptide repeat-containing protein n=1 Tax=Flavobacterium okayamense TaxID=2830782 RepID=A0ABN6HW27_9FLAO|nr:hypothetical protein [Flavobacterium okayamense]BCY28649.1 hypothetical protein KK2020170_15170 [Flavobacterium okayamense]
MKSLFSLIFLLVNINAFSQLDDNKKALLYFTEAERLFNQNDFKQAIEYVEKTEQVLGSSNARTLNLKVKAYYNNGEFKKAESSLNLFINEHQNNASEEIKSETLSYFVRIEKAVEEKQNEIDRLKRIKDEKEEKKRKEKEYENKMHNIINNYGKEDDRYSSFAKKVTTTEFIFTESDKEIYALKIYMTSKTSGNKYIYHIGWSCVGNYYKTFDDNKYKISIEQSSISMIEGGNASKGVLVRIYRKLPSETKYLFLENSKVKTWDIVFFTEKRRDEFYDAMSYFIKKYGTVPKYNNR